MWKKLLWLLGLLVASGGIRLGSFSFQNTLSAAASHASQSLELQEYNKLKPDGSVNPPPEAFWHRQHRHQHPRAPLERSKSSLRRIQEAEAAEVTVVRTAEQLLDAFVNGVTHIQLREHLDLTVLNVSPSFRLGPVPVTVKSIRGNCTKAAPTAAALGLPSGQAPLREFTPRQCMLLTRYDFPSGTHTIWLDKLYIRSATSLTGSFGELLEVWGADARLFMTHVTLQGSGDGSESCEDCGLDVWEKAAVYAEDCMFTDFAGVRVLRAFAGAAVSLLRCAFINNALFPSNFGAAIIQADGDDRYGSSQVRLQGCTFINNTPPSLPVLLADNRDDISVRAEFFSDSPEPQVCVYEGPDDSSAPPPCMMVSPGGLGDSDAAFLDAKNPWLQQVQEEVESPSTRVRISQSALAAPPGTPGANVAAAKATSTNATSAITEKESVGAAMFVLVAVAAVLLLMTVAGLAVALRKRRHVLMTPQAAEALRAHGHQKFSFRGAPLPPPSSMHGRHARGTQHENARHKPGDVSLELRPIPPATQNATTDTRNDERADSDVFRNVSHGRTVTFTVKSASHISTAQRHSSLGRAWDLKSGSSDRKDTEKSAPGHPKPPESQNAFSCRERFSEEPIGIGVAPAAGEKSRGDSEDSMHEQEPCSHPASEYAETAAGGQKGICEPQNTASKHGKKRGRSRFEPMDIPVAKTPGRNSFTCSHAAESTGAKSGTQAFEPAVPSSRRSSIADDVTISNPYAETSSSNNRGTSSFCEPSKPRSFRSLSRASGAVSGTEASLKHLAAAAHPRIQQSSAHAWQCSGPEATVSAGVRSRMHVPRHMLHTDPMHGTSPVGRDSLRTANSEPGIPDYEPPVDTACAAHEDLDYEDDTLAYATAVTSSDSLNLLYGTALIGSGSGNAERGASGEDTPPDRSQTIPEPTPLRAPRIFEAPVHRMLPEPSAEPPQNPPPVGLSRSAVEVGAPPDTSSHLNNARGSSGSSSNDQNTSNACTQHSARSNAACYIRLSDPGRTCSHSGPENPHIHLEKTTETSASTVAAPEATFAAFAGTADTRAGSSSTGGNSNSPNGLAVAAPAGASPFDGGVGGGAAVAPPGATGSVSTLDLMGLSEGVKQPGFSSARDSYVTSNTCNANDTDKQTIFSSYDAESERDAQGRLVSPKGPTAAAATAAAAVDSNSDSKHGRTHPDRATTALDAGTFEHEGNDQEHCEKAKDSGAAEGSQHDSDAAVQGSKPLEAEEARSGQQRGGPSGLHEAELTKLLKVNDPQHTAQAPVLTLHPAPAPAAAAAASAIEQEAHMADDEVHERADYADDAPLQQHGLMATELQSMDFESTIASAADAAAVEPHPTCESAIEATTDTPADAVHTGAVDMDVSPDTNMNVNVSVSVSSPNEKVPEASEEDAQEDIGQDRETAGARQSAGDVFSESDESSLSQWTFELPSLQPGSLEHVSLKLEDVHEPRTEPPKKPRSKAPTSEWLEYIQQQLDGYGPTPLLLNRYELLGPQHRCCGGQGVVQFARRIHHTGTQLYAIKFYARVRTFQEESEIYKSSPLRHFMPTVSRIERNEDGAIRDPFGKALAPFVVMEKGESLQEKLGNRDIDGYKAAQVLGHISQRLAQLHDAGFVHRDLKPGNIMWQPRTCTWVLIDFGLAARISRTARVGCTPPYAAPETASALQRRQRTTTAEAAVDVWALGVIAFELLLQRPAFGPFVSVDQIFERLIDSSQPLPWEEGCITLEEKKALGKFRKPLLKLLKRRPAERATAKDFCKQMAAIYSSSPRASTFRGATPMRW